MKFNFINFKNVKIISLLLCTNITSLLALSLSQNISKEDNLVTSGHGGTGEEPEKLSSFEFWVKLTMIFLLVLLGGLIAGLTLGLMSLDETNLTILINSGTPEQRKYASLILPIRKNGHLLLVTLLLTNTLINESLPIFLDSVFGGGYIAIFVSTGLILVFGEVIPQSICARHGLRIGAFFAWPVRILIFATYIITYPIAKGLDWLLGEHHGYMYRRAELKELVAIHEATKGGSLTTDEVTIIRGALDLSEKSANHAMTDLKHVFMLNIDSILDTFVLSDIVRAGHSRIPVFENERTNIIGVLLAKSLIMVDPNAFTPVRNIKIYNILSVPHDTSLFDLLNTFQEGACHMTVVTENINGQSIATGVVTLEDVIEELIQEEIIDETDVYSDVVTRTKVTRALNLAGIKRITKSRMNSTGAAAPGSGGADLEINETTPLKQQDKRLLAVQQDKLRQIGSATPDPCTRRTKLFTTPKEEADPLKFTRFTSFQNAKERQHLRPFAEADRENESDSDHSPIVGSV